MDAEPDTEPMSTGDIFRGQTNADSSSPQDYASIFGVPRSSPSVMIEASPDNVPKDDSDDPSQMDLDLITDGKSLPPKLVSPSQQHVVEKSSNESTNTSKEDRKVLKRKIGDDGIRSLRTTRPSFVIPKDLRFLTSRMVSLHIGPPPLQAAFYVHRELLTAVSPVFEAAFRERDGDGGDSWAKEGDDDQMGGEDNGGFREARQGSMEMPEEHVEDWTYFLQWLYRRLGSTLYPPPNPNPLYHALVDDPVENFHQYITTRRAIAKEVSTELEQNPIAPSPPISTDGFQGLPAAMQHMRDVARWREAEIARRCPRPGPPAFGPLVRLYLLADRWDVGGGLREEIVRSLWKTAYARCTCGGDSNGCVARARRMNGVAETRGLSAGSQDEDAPRDIRHETHRERPHPIFVPDVGDVNRIWRGLPMEKVEFNRLSGFDLQNALHKSPAAFPGKTWEEVWEGVRKPGLKDVVLELFVQMKGVGDFGVSGVREDGEGNSETGSGIDGGAEGGGVGVKVVLEERREEHDNEFLMDLVGRLLSRRCLHNGR